MSLRTFMLQMAFLFAPLVPGHTTEAEPGIYRGQDPKMKEIRELQQQGIKTIISLRTNPQRKKARLAQSLGMKWVNIPTGVFKVPTNVEFDSFRAVVNNPANKPCYVSCEVDSDRVGLYLAAHRLVDLGWTPEQVQADFKKNHQKTWWPPFRKYYARVVSYAESNRAAQARKQESPSLGSTTNVVAPSLAPPTIASPSAEQSRVQ